MTNKSNIQDERLPFGLHFAEAISLDECETTWQIEYDEVLNCTVVDNNGCRTPLVEIAKKVFANTDRH